MSHFIDRLKFFVTPTEGFADKHGATVDEDRTWEDGYRKRWQHDKIVRSTHGTNCTGSCSWKIYVKGGIVTWETQQTDYPRTRPDMPNHEPRGCQRDGVAIRGISLCHGRRGQCRARARAILDNDRLAEILGCEFGKLAECRVGRAARGESDQQSDRPVRIGVLSHGKLR